MKKPDNDDAPFLWISEFEEEAFKDYYSKFAELENDDSVIVIPVFIASYGGESAVAFGLRDLIKSSTKPVATMAIGHAMSSGAILLAAGTPGFRFAAPNTQIMIHQVSGGAIGKCAELQNEAAWVEACNDMMLRGFEEDTGKPASAFDKEMTKRKNTDWVLTAKMAKSWNIIDHIGIPRFYAEPAYYNMVIPGELEKDFQAGIKNRVKKKSNKTPQKKTARKTQRKTPRKRPKRRKS